VDAREYLQRQFARVRLITDGVMRETTDEQFNWTPPGTANSIGVTFLHMVGSEDRYVQSVLQGKPPLWESEGWDEQIGAVPPGGGRGWEEARGATLAVTPALEYAQAVRAATDAYLATITPEELERPVHFLGGERPVAEVLATLVVHAMGHMGEIAALKGVLGVKGLPF